MIAQESLLTALREQLNELSQIYREQSALSERFERSSKFWKTFSIIGLPAAALLSAGITALIMAGR
jgi:hypothetical protein